MAKIADVLTTEQNRQASGEWGKIHLFEMGDFYRAYEWSAWLISVITYNDKVRNQTRDRRPLKISHKQLANSPTTFCFVGFPIKSVEKFIPTRENFESAQNENKHVICTITLPQPTDGTELTYERLHSAFLEWKKTLPLSTKPDNIDADGNKIPPKPKPQKPRTDATPAAASSTTSISIPKGGKITITIVIEQN